MIDLKCAGWVDAGVGPFLKDENPPKPPIFVIVRGLTQEGWDALKRLATQDAAPTSGWDQLVSFTQRSLPHFKSRGEDSSLPPGG